MLKEDLEGKEDQLTPYKYDRDKENSIKCMNYM